MRARGDSSAAGSNRNRLGPNYSTRIQKGLTFEHVTQVASARATDDLCTLHSPRVVLDLGHRARDRVEERRPAAAAVELGAGLVKRRAASGAAVDALPNRMIVLAVSVRSAMTLSEASWTDLLGVVLIILARASHLSALLTKDAELFLAQLSCKARRAR